LGFATLYPTYKKSLQTQNSTRAGGFCLCRRGFNRPVKLIRLTRHYNVAEKDPEVMEKYQGFNTHAQFHESYLKALFAAKNLSYSPKKPEMF